MTDPQVAHRGTVLGKSTGQEGSQWEEFARVGMENAVNYYPFRNDPAKRLQSVSSGRARPTWNKGLDFVGDNSDAKFEDFLGLAPAGYPKWASMYQGGHLLGNANLSVTGAPQVNAVLITTDPDTNEPRKSLKQILKDSRNRGISTIHVFLAGPRPTSKIRIHRIEPFQYGLDPSELETYWPEKPPEASPYFVKAELSQRTTAVIEELRSYDEQTVPIDQLKQDPRHSRLLEKLQAAFEDEPFENGIAHEAEQIIVEAIQDGAVLYWFDDVCTDTNDPSFAASVLRCLGRQAEIGNDDWRNDLIRQALASKDMEIRDAAVQTIEAWGGKQLLNILKDHDEPEAWIQAYINDVINDMGA